MNLAELIIKTIKDEVSQAKSEIIKEIRSGGISLESDASVFLSGAKNYGLKSNAKPVFQHKAPAAHWDDSEVKDWIKYNHKIISEIVYWYRKGNGGARHAAKAIQDKYGITITNSEIYNTMHVLRANNFVAGKASFTNVTDKFRQVTQ